MPRVGSRDTRGPGPELGPATPSGDMLGDRVASGDRAGEKEGDIADCDIIS